ncbi:MAG: roadblock/LC7 domain-containing protein [Kineosporiaceae bacterium]
MALRALAADVPGVRSAVLATSDGLVAVAEPSADGADEIAAMTAAVVARAQQIASVAVGGALEDCSIRTGTGAVCLVSVTDRYVLALGASDGVPLGLVLRQCRTAADVLATILTDRFESV